MVMTQREHQSLRRTQRHCAACVASLPPPGQNGAPGNNPRVEAEDPHHALLPWERGASRHRLSVQILPGSQPMNCVAVCWPLTPPTFACDQCDPLFPFAVNTHLTLTYLWLCVLFRVKKELYDTTVLLIAELEQSFLLMPKNFPRYI